MPKTVHKKLAKEAHKKGLHGTRKNAYVYGALQRIDKMRKEKK